MIFKYVENVLSRSARFCYFVWSFKIDASKCGLWQKSENLFNADCEKLHKTK